MLSSSTSSTRSRPTYSFCSCDVHEGCIRHYPLQRLTPAACSDDSSGIVVVVAMVV